MSQVQSQLLTCPAQYVMWSKDFFFEGMV